MSIHCVILIIALCGLTKFAHAEEPQQKPGWLMPDLAQIQFAGNKGMFSAYSGWFLDRNKYLDLAMGYGFAPASQTYEAVHKLLVQLSYHFGLHQFFRENYLKPFIGLGGSYQLFSSELTFFGLPDFIPSGYYSPNAVRAHLDLGLELTRTLPDLLSGIGIYMLVTTNDLYLYNALKSSEVKFMQAFSLGLGLRVYFFD